MDHYKSKQESSRCSPRRQTGDRVVLAQARIVSLQEKLTVVEREKLDLSSQVHQLQLLLQDERSLVRELQTQLRMTEAECEALRTSLKSAVLQVEESSHLELTRMRSEISTLQRELAESKAKNAKACRLMDDMENKLITTCGHLQGVENDHDQSQAELRRLEQMLQDNIELHDKMTSEKNAEIVRLLGLVEALNAELTVFKTTNFGPVATRKSTHIQEAQAMVQMLENRLQSLEAQQAATVRFGALATRSNLKDVDDCKGSTSSRAVRPLGAEVALTHRTSTQDSLGSRSITPNSLSYRSDSSGHSKESSMQRSTRSRSIEEPSSSNGSSTSRGKPNTVPKTSRSPSDRLPLASVPEKKARIPQLRSTSPVAYNHEDIPGRGLGIYRRSVTVR